MIHHLKHLIHKSRFKERFGYLGALLEHQSMSEHELFLRQQREVKKIVSFAKEHTDYYQEKYREALQDGADKLVMGALPVLHKDEVIKYRDAMVDRDLDRRVLRTGNTGGSTGKPLAFYYDSHKIELMRAGMCRSYMWSGWMPGQKVLNFWGARQDIKGRKGFRKKVDDYIAAEKTIGAYEYTDADLVGWVKTIQSYKPVLLQGYASILAELAKYVIEQGIQIPKTLKGVYSTAEVLYEWQRGTIENAFSCKVFNQYGSREIPNIACECPHGNTHIFTDMVYMESVNDNGEDKLLVTSLTNRVMPFIRYEIGDSGRLKEGDCDCGSPFPMMEMGVCRSNDIVRTQQGKNIYPSYFIHLLDGMNEINQFQFIQNGLNSLTLNLVSSSRLGSDKEASIQQRINAEIDEAMVVGINYVDEIKRSRSGKHRFVINDLD